MQELENPTNQSIQQNTKSKQSSLKNKSKRHKEEKHRLQLPSYILSWLILVTIDGSIVFTIYYHYFYDVIINILFKRVNTLADFFIDPINLGILLLTPIVVIGGYFVYLFMHILFVKVMLIYFHKRVPLKEGSYRRSYHEHGKFLKVHNFRTFVIRFTKYKLVRCPFPWLINWAWNFLKLGKIGKGAVLEDIYHPYDFIEIGENAYIGTGTRIVTQTVEGAFGRLIFEKIQIGDNAMICENGIQGPGCYLGDNSIMLPNSACPKAYKLKDNRVFVGAPPNRLTHKNFLKHMFADPTEMKQYFKKKSTK